MAAEVRSVGLTPVAAASEDPVAVVQGHSPATGWNRLAEACLAIRGGAMWVACNVDPTLPTERGLLPGNGAMVAALQVATDREPTVAGKPARALLDTAMERAGAQRPLVVGDRLDTDIAGARAAELDSLLVLSGVADAAALLAAPPQHRPSHLGARPSSAAGVLLSRRGSRRGLAGASMWPMAVCCCTARGRPAEAGDPLDALRALCAAWWVEHSGQVQVCACDDTSAVALDRVGLGESGGRPDDVTTTISRSPELLLASSNPSAGLQDLDDLPTVEHVARFTALHNSLTAALSSIDDVSARIGEGDGRRVDGRRVSGT